MGIAFDECLKGTELETNDRKLFKNVLHRERLFKYFI